MKSMPTGRYPQRVNHSTAAVTEHRKLKKSDTYIFEGNKKLVM